MATPPLYEERYCAFVDILGFRQFIQRLRRDNSQFEALREVLQKVHSPSPGNPIDESETDFRAQSISDAVAVSTAVNPHGLAQLFYGLESLSLDLLARGYFVRGGIVKGGLYHDEQMVFGEALVEAYGLETNHACYPRIMIKSDVCADARKYVEEDNSWNEFLPRMTRQSRDGPWYLDVLHRMSQRVDTVRKLDPDIDATKSTELRPVVAMRNQIQRCLNETVDNPRHFEKVQWFAAYWNQSITQIKGMPRIDGPGVNEIIWVAG
jgi:hypothetical protein